MVECDQVVVMHGGDRVVVTCGGERLEDDHMLVDLPFPYDVITIACPDDAVYFREETPPFELEPDFFSTLWS